MSHSHSATASSAANDRGARSVAEGILLREAVAGALVLVRQP